MKEEHIESIILDMIISGKRRKGRPNLRRKDACNRDMTEVRLKEDNTANMAAWRKKITKYWRPQMTVQVRHKEEVELYSRGLHDV